MKTRSVLTTGVLILCALVFVPLAAQSPRPRTFTPVTEAMLRNPPPAIANDRRMMRLRRTSDPSKKG